MDQGGAPFNIPVNFLVPHNNPLAPNSDQNYGPPSYYFLGKNNLYGEKNNPNNDNVTNVTNVSDIYDFDNKLSNNGDMKNDIMKMGPVQNDLTKKILTAMENDMNNSHCNSHSIYTSEDNIKITTSESDSDVDESKPKSKLSRKDFRETIGRQIYDDILSDIFSYEDIIEKYKKLYPQYSSKFTKNFCSKIRCGRIMNSTTKLSKRRVCDGDPKMKRIKKRSPKNTWHKMTDELFKKMCDYERDHPNIKQSDLQKLFNVNRSTFWRWKKRYNVL